jgi:hypothetical protein
VELTVLSSYLNAGQLAGVAVADGWGDAEGAVVGLAGGTSLTTVNV